MELSELVLGPGGEASAYSPGLAWGLDPPQLGSPPPFPVPTSARIGQDHELENPTDSGSYSSSVPHLVDRLAYQLCHWLASRIDSVGFSLKGCLEEMEIMYALITPATARPSSGLFQPSLYTPPCGLFACQAWELLEGRNGVTSLCITSTQDAAGLRRREAPGVVRKPKGRKRLNPAVCPGVCLSIPLAHTGAEKHMGT